MNSPAVIIRNVTKRYFFEKPRTLKKWFNSLFSPYGKFTVIQNYSMTVNKGEFVLITGPNGCGKTTLLKLIAGITLPDEGTIQTIGKVVPLIELGSGFNHELTGRENIITNATILGIAKKNIMNIIPKIIRFAELENFIDIPIKRYSTGMRARLAFSIAIYSEPDILLLDEIFAVGDRNFVKKSIGKLEEFKKNGITIVLCSHMEIRNSLVDRRTNLSFKK